MKKLQQMETSGVVDAAQTAYDEVEQLNEELTSWYDNLPESFQNGSKGDALQEATGTLENVTSVEIPDCGAELTCSYSPLKKRASRSARCGYASEILNAVAGALRDRAQELSDKEFMEPVDDADETEEVEGSTTEPATEDERDTMVQDLESAADEIEGHASELEGVDFPGMYG